LPGGDFFCGGSSTLYFRSQAQLQQVHGDESSCHLPTSLFGYVVAITPNRNYTTHIRRPLLFLILNCIYASFIAHMFYLQNHFTNYLTTAMTNQSPHPLPITHYPLLRYCFTRFRNKKFVGFHRPFADSSHDNSTYPTL
jgi:hypothetical protein